MAGRILIVDDEGTALEFLGALLEAEGFETVGVDTGVAGLAKVEGEEFDAVLTDLHMAGMDGIELCRRISQLRPDLPVVVVTGEASLDAAVSALRAGAYDFLTKPIDPKRLGPAARRAVEHGRLGREVKRLRRALDDTTRFGEIVGESAAMRRLYDLIERVADAEASVLVTGESGTGKELIARSIHQRSRRVEGPFVALNCAAVPASLLESELFGHVKGAFTDAKGSRPGLFVQADGGTLFLDEIGELPLEMQPKLLRAIQEREVRPVGATADVKFDARIITATNRDLEADVEAGRFREDLLYRVDVVRVELPALRRRGRDVLLLAQTFLQRYADRSGREIREIDPAAAERLLAYDWPGNVRELENCMERAVALCRGPTVHAEELPKKVRDYQSDRVFVTTDEPGGMPTLEELEKRYVTQVLRATGGNKSQAAKVLGLDRRTLYRRLDKYGIES
jgi:two-component system response regulator HydG